MIEEKDISENDALKLIKNEEGHFFDRKAKEISGRKLQVTAVSFANADSGEIFIGIDDIRDGNFNISKWRGFQSIEDANRLIQTTFVDISPSLNLSYEFLEIQNKEEFGKVLRISIDKSGEVHRTSEGKVFVRKGAQNLEISGDSIVNLKLSKGLITSEDQLLSNFGANELSSTSELKKFLYDYSPTTPPLEFLQKQRLVRKEDTEEKATYSGTLLYAENPSVVLPKKCSIKISRYNTSEKEPRREHLKEQHTIEGPLYEQISKALERIQIILQQSPVMTESGLAKAKYPVEAIKEILVNAVIHRDYNISDDVLVFIFNNRMEIKNPGRLPGHITTQNILSERFARNPRIVRLLNKYPDPPNKDIGEGLNTAFEKMREVKLKPPVFEVLENAVVVVLPHQPLAKPEESVLEYLSKNNEINNTIARKITGINSENVMKKVFYKLRDIDKIEPVPGKRGANFAWRLKSE